MAIERPPKLRNASLAQLATYRPPTDLVGTTHVVKPGRRETLASVAAQYGVRVEDLCALNFPGSVVDGKLVPSVVNWYLHHHESFDCPETHDKKNRVFDGGEILYIPIRTQRIDFSEGTTIVVEREKPSNVWVGAGYKGGTTFAVVGTETSQIVGISIDGFSRAFTATVRGSRLGLGWGASGGPFIVVIASMRTPGQLQGHMTKDSGLSLAIGVKAGGKLKAPKGYSQAAEALLEFAAKYGDKGAKAVAAGKQLAKYRQTFLDLASSLGMKRDAPQPDVKSIGLPVGGFGLELSYNVVVSEFDVLATWGG